MKADDSPSLETSPPSLVIAMSAHPTKTSLFSYVSHRYERIVCAEALVDSGILSCGRGSA